MIIPKIRVNIPIIKPPTGAIVTPNIIHYLLFKIIMSSIKGKLYLFISASTPQTIRKTPTTMLRGNQLNRINAPATMAIIPATTPLMVILFFAI
jgi:hypothetical protein